jgi:two-component system CheB/CheR fusion protein
MADFPIVGIGSSAGGLEALEKLFDVIEIEGEPVPLAPHQGLGLSLVMHELGTNAAKYGALSPSDGRVRVSWQVEQGDDGRRVRLLWEERGGPRVQPPTNKSFGTRLIERACTHELEGEVELDYAPSGLRCELVFPLSRTGAQPA